MTLRWSLPLVALAAFSILGIRETAAIENGLQPRIKVSLGYHYSSGTYGTSDTTEIAYVPLIAKVDLGPWSIQLTVPYLRISGPAGLAEAPNGPTFRTTSGESDGLGDVLLRGSYTIEPPTLWIPFVDVVGLIKFPTASRAQGLGTGEFDFGLESDFFWSVDRFTPFATIGYRFFGSPPGIDLNDVIVASLGSMYRIVERLHGGLLLDYRQASSASVGERLELVPFGSWLLDSHWSVDLYVSAGLATGSPAVGTGLQLAYTW